MAASAPCWQIVARRLKGSPRVGIRKAPFMLRLMVRCGGLWWSAELSSKLQFH